MQPYYVPFQAMTNSQKLAKAIAYLESRNRYALNPQSQFQYIPASKQIESGIAYKRQHD